MDEKKSDWKEFPVKKERKQIGSIAISRLVKLSVSACYLKEGKEIAWKTFTRDDRIRRVEISTTAGMIR